MEKPVIGIRQADGSFYEIMDEAQSGQKRLVLSAARSDQRGVRIDLYRSPDGTIDSADALGSISLDDPQGLGYQDIEFLVGIGADDQLAASAALPGQPPQTLSIDLSSFRAPRTDADILGDESFAAADLDTLDDSFSAEPSSDFDPEPMTLDLPDAEEPPSFEEEPHRSDADILGGDDFAMADLDALDDFALEEETAEPPSTPAAERGSFDLDDLDAGFADPGLDEPASPEVESAAEPEEAWEKISLDDMEPMEFMDTGDEISAPTKLPPPKAAPPPSKTKPVQDDFGMDEEPLELADFDSDLSDLPDFDDESKPSSKMDSPSSEDEFDMDFLPPPALTEPSGWDEEPAKGKASKPPKPAKVPKAAKRVPAAASSSESSASLDKTALFLSLAALSLLVLLILVLLFLNMIKAPTPPAIQPEVMGWNPSLQTAAARVPSPSVIDLGSSAATFEASTVLEVPEALRRAQISLRLAPGETVDDASRRFGPPARVQGNQLFW